MKDKFCFTYCGDRCDCQESIVTHMDILSFINGWDLVSKDNVVTNGEVPEDEEETDSE